MDSFTIKERHHQWLSEEKSKGESAVPLWFYQRQWNDNEDEAWPNVVLQTNHVSARAGDHFFCEFWLCKRGCNSSRDPDTWILPWLSKCLRKLSFMTTPNQNIRDTLWGEGRRRGGAGGRKNELKGNQSGDREPKKNGSFPFLVCLIYLLLFPVVGHSGARLSVSLQLKRSGNVVSWQISEGWVSVSGRSILGRHVHVWDTLEETLFRRDGKCKSISVAANMLSSQLWLYWKPASFGKSWDRINNHLKTSSQ